MDAYRFKAKGIHDGQTVEYEDVVYDETAFEAAEQADAIVRDLYPGIVLDGDNPATGATESPKVYVTRDIVNRIVADTPRDPRTGNLMRGVIPDEFKVGPSITTIVNQGGKVTATDGVVTEVTRAAPPQAPIEVQEIKPAGLFRRILQWWKAGL